MTLTGVAGGCTTLVLCITSIWSVTVVQEVMQRLSDLAARRKTSVLLQALGAWRARANHQLLKKQQANTACEHRKAYELATAHAAWRIIVKVQLFLQGQVVLELQSTSLSEANSGDAACFVLLKP